MPNRDLSDLVQKMNVGNRDRLIYTNPERNTPLQKPGTGTKTLCRSNILFSEELSIKSGRGGSDPSRQGISSISFQVLKSETCDPYMSLFGGIKDEKITMPTVLVKRSRVNSIDSGKSEKRSSSI